MSRGQNAAITFAQITMLLLTDRPQLDDVVAMRVLASLQAETGGVFIKVSRRLKREDDESRRAKNKPLVERAARQSR